MSLLFHVVHPYKQQCSWLSRFIKQTCSWLTWSWFTGALCLCCLGHMVWNPTPSLSQKVGVWTQLFIPLSLWPSLDWMNASCFNMNIEKEEPFWKNIQPTALNRSTNIEAPSFCQIRHSRDSRDSKLEKLRITLFSDFFPGDLSLYTILKGEKNPKIVKYYEQGFWETDKVEFHLLTLCGLKSQMGKLTHMNLLGMDNCF